jgi:hypothetical protein
MAAGVSDHIWKIEEIVALLAEHVTLPNEGQGRNRAWVR